jgi:lipoprotein-releasing system permease protein
LNFSLYIAKRYLFTKSSNNAINIISVIAAFGVIIGAAALFVVLSGFAGLKDFTLQFSSFVDPDLKVLPSQGKSFLFNEEQLKILDANSDIASYSKVIEERVVLNHETKNEIITLKGVDQNYPQIAIDSILVQGKWFDAESNQIVSGWGVSNNLAFGVFQFNKAIDIYVPKAGLGQVSSMKGAYNSMKAINSGVFQINEELDNSLVFASFETAKMLLNYSDNRVSSIEILLKNPSDSNSVSEQLSSLFGEVVVVKNRLQLNDKLYKMLNTENLAVYLIFTLVLIIALFNVIGSIIMMILDKKKNLNTLFSLGVTMKEIKRIFFYQGSLLTLLGGILGVALGFILVLLQKTFGWFPITPTLPYPVEIKSMNVLIVLATITVLGLVASKIASSRISEELVSSY